LERAFNREILGPDGEIMKDDNGKFIKDLDIEENDDNTNINLEFGQGSTPLSRRILNKLQEDLWSQDPRNILW
jgi:hypothetical protein